MKRSGGVWWRVATVDRFGFVLISSYWCFVVSGEQAEANGVTWDCSAEFDATSEQDISFQEADASYVTFSSSLSKTGSTVKMALKTLTREGEHWSTANRISIDFYWNCFAARFEPPNSSRIKFDRNSANQSN